MMIVNCCCSVCHDLHPLETLRCGNTHDPLPEKHCHPLLWGAACASDISHMVLFGDIGKPKQIMTAPWGSGHHNLEKLVATTLKIQKVIYIYI